MRAYLTPMPLRHSGCTCPASPSAMTVSARIAGARFPAPHQMAQAKGDPHGQRSEEVEQGNPQTQSGKTQDQCVEPDAESRLHAGRREEEALTPSPQI